MSSRGPASYVCFPPHKLPHCASWWWRISRVRDHVVFSLTAHRMRPWSAARETPVSVSPIMAPDPIALALLFSPCDSCFQTEQANEKLLVKLEGLKQHAA